MDVGASMLRGIEPVGGRLKVTNRRVIFEGSGLGLFSYSLDIPFDNIRGVAPYNSMGIFPNGLRIDLISGVEYGFRVWKRDELIRTIRAYLTNA